MLNVWLTLAFTCLLICEFFRLLQTVLILPSVHEYQNMTRIIIILRTVYKLRVLPIHLDLEV